MVDYIYSRVSTSTQSVDPQLFDLIKMFPTAKVITETCSGAKYRPILDALIKKLIKDDRLIVAALDRIGRHTLDLLQTMESLEKKGVIVKSIREGIDYATPVGRLLPKYLQAFSRWKENLIRERSNCPNL